MNEDAAQRRLDNALGQLSHVFRNCRGTSHWGDMTDSSVTIKHGVWDLTDGEFRDFCRHSVFGPASEWPQAIRYFLPRVAFYHTTVSDPLQWSLLVWDLDYLAMLLNTAKWQSWPEVEVAAIREWLYAWIQMQACDGDWWQNAITTRCAAQAGCDLFDFFNDFRQAHPTTSVVWLAAELERHWDAMLTTGWPSLWQECWGTPTASAVVERFLLLLLRQSSRQLLEQTFFDNQLSPEHQSLVSSALEHANQCVDFGNVWPDAPLGRVLGSDELQE